MLEIKKFSKNEKEFLKLKNFCKKIIIICKKEKIDLILYGSLAFFIYTKNDKIEINDIDFLVKEKNFKKIIKLLELKKINYNYDKKWHVLQIFKEGLKIELDSIDFWKINTKKNIGLNFFGQKIKILDLNNLKKVYKKASKKSDDKKKNINKNLKN